MADGTKRGLSRRASVKATVAIGGPTALSACVIRESAPDLPQGPDDLSTLPMRQHAWNEFLDLGNNDNHLGPHHRVLLYLRYRKNGPPTRKDGKRMERALRTLEQAYPHSHNGLLFTVSYSPSYFAFFDDAEKTGWLIQIAGTHRLRPDQFRWWCFHCRRNDRAKRENRNRTSELVHSRIPHP